MNLKRPEELAEWHLANTDDWMGAPGERDERAGHYRERDEEIVKMLEERRDLFWSYSRSPINEFERDRYAKASELDVVIAAIRASWT